MSQYPHYDMFIWNEPPPEEVDPSWKRVTKPNIRPGWRTQKYWNAWEAAEYCGLDHKTIHANVLPDIRLPNKMWLASRIRQYDINRERT